MKQRAGVRIALMVLWAAPCMAWAQGELAIVHSTFAPSATSSNGTLVLPGTIG